MGALPVLLIIGAVVALSLLWLSIRVVKLRNLKSLVEIGVDKNTTVVFPAPLMSTIGDLGAFLRREVGAAAMEPGGAAGTVPATTNGGGPRAVELG
jgi:hypothetical protein